MNIKISIRLSKAALILLLSFLTAYSSGFHAGRTFAEKEIRQPADIEIASVNNAS